MCRIWFMHTTVYITKYKTELCILDSTIHQALFHSNNLFASDLLIFGYNFQETYQQQIQTTSRRTIKIELFHKWLSLILNNILETVFLCLCDTFFCDMSRLQWTIFYRFDFIKNIYRWFILYYFI